MGGKFGAFCTAFVSRRVSFCLHERFSNYRRRFYSRFSLAAAFLLHLKLALHFHCLAIRQLGVTLRLGLALGNLFGIQYRLGSFNNLDRRSHFTFDQHTLLAHLHLNRTRFTRHRIRLLDLGRRAPRQRDFLFFFRLAVRLLQIIQQQGLVALGQHNAYRKRFLDPGRR